MQNKDLNNRITGTHYIIDLFGCNRQQINSVAFLKKVMSDSIEGTDIVLLDNAFYPFKPQGVTGFFLLSTSHMSVHSWPEYGYLSIDVYTCSNDESTRKVVDYILEKILHRKMVIKTVDRTYNLLSDTVSDANVLQMPVYRDNSEQLIHITNRICDIKSGFQQIQVVDTEEFGRAMLIDGVMQTTEKDHHIYDEAILASLTDSDKEIIILGGGDGYVAATAIEKIPSLKVTIIDLDVEVVFTAKRYLSQNVFDNPNVTLHIGDALQYMKLRNGEKVDGIVFDLTDNPLVTLNDSYEEDYTRFFKAIFPIAKKHLKNNGWISVQAGAANVTGKYLDTAGIVEKLVTNEFREVERANILIPSFGEENSFIKAKNQHE